MKAYIAQYQKKIFRKEATFCSFIVFVGSMKTKFLSDLAEIRFGINTRTSDHGNIPCVQGKDFDDFGQLQTAGLSYISEDQCKDTDFLQPGDVLFAAKGARNYAVCWTGQLSKAVASSTFFVVRNFTDSVLPDYLAWFLMSAKAGRYFEQNVKLATVRTISKKVMENLKIPVSNANHQNDILQLSLLWRKEKLLTTKIQHKYDYLIRHIEPS
ncbi:MAG: restriction endonuclease subunit S [Cryomorphaceae bacterium]|nr:MAG: restriction endonuclease subunit S [Cryomorphaceae bacterium]